MQAPDTVQRVRIYLNENDDVGGRPLYLATLELLRESGATGATALRGVAGFGASQHLRTSQGDATRGMPVVIEWIDRAERVARVLPALDSLLPTALITLEPVQIYRATLRASSPFGERAIGELAARDVATISRQQSMADAARVLLAGAQNTIPVLDEDNRLQGTLGEADLERRGLPRVAHLRTLPAQEREQLLGTLAASPVVDGLSAEVLALTADSSILQAAKAMVEWGLDQVPVISRDGRFYGMFGVDQALQAALEARAPADGPIRDADTLAPVGMLMQGAMQTILGYAPAIEAIDRLLAAREQPLVVVDNGRPLGMLSFNQLVDNVEEPLRVSVFGATRGGEGRASLATLLNDKRVASLPLESLPPLPATAGYDQAITLLHEQGTRWIAIVDEAGKIQGLIGRRTLLRALVQESGS